MLIFLQLVFLWACSTVNGCRGWQTAITLYLPHHVQTCNPFDCAEHTRHNCLLLLRDILTTTFEQISSKRCCFRNIVYIGPDLLYHSGHIKGKKIPLVSNSVCSYCVVGVHIYISLAVLIKLLSVIKTLFIIYINWIVNLGSLLWIL